MTKKTRKKENAARIKNLKAKRDGLVAEYRTFSMRMSDLQDQISDVEGDIRMLELDDEQQKRKSSQRV